MVKTKKSKIGCAGLWESGKIELHGSEVKERKTDAGDRTIVCWGETEIGCLRSRRRRQRRRRREKGS